MSIIKQEEINKIISNVKATLELEGLETSSEALIIGGKYLNDEITIDEAIEMIKKRIK